MHGFAATKEDRELRKKKNVPEENLNDPVDRWIHYFGVPTIQVRHSLPLPSIPIDKFPLSSTPTNNSDGTPKTINKEFNVPNYDFDPQIYHKLPYERRHGVSIPGEFIQFILKIFT